MDRPPLWYTYKQYYEAVKESKAHIEFCKRVYGRNLSQDGFSDMHQIDKFLELAQIDSTSTVLDLGCGSGLISEYISDVTGAVVYGVDYIPDAIEHAEERTSDKRERLKFYTGNLDHITFLQNSFDCIISIDSLYMPNNLDSTIKQIISLLKPGGKLMAFYSQFSWGSEEDRERLKAENTDLAVVLKSNQLTFDTVDYSKENYEFMQRKNKIVKSLRQLYEDEGNMFLYEKLIRESISNEKPYEPHASFVSRYLYMAGI